METAEHAESDLGTAAFLVVKGFELLGLVSNGGDRYAFNFADPGGKAAEEAMAYLQGASVPAKAIIAAQKDLKTLLYGRKGYGNGKENGRRH